MSPEPGAPGPGPSAAAAPEAQPPELSLDVRLRAGGFELEARVLVSEGPLVLVGPNGGGKTSLLRALAGGDIEVEGRIAVRGLPWVDSAAGLSLPPEARSVGYLPQGGSLFPHLDALDNVAFGVPEARAETRRTRARLLLEELGVGELARRRPRRLSGGERQRVALARALARSPALLLLDEPTTSLDVSVRRGVRSLLGRELRVPGRLGVVVTHDVRDLVAWDPVVALVDDGQVRLLGRLDALPAEPEHPFLAELLAPLRG